MIDGWREMDMMDGGGRMGWKGKGMTGEEGMDGWREMDMVEGEGRMGWKEKGVTEGRGGRMGLQLMFVYTGYRGGNRGMEQDGSGERDGYSG